MRCFLRGRGVPGRRTRAGNAHLLGMVVGSFGHSSYRPHVVPIEVSETMSQPVVEEEI